MSGGLEEAEIRKAICDILEGGQKAFRERARRRRGRWKLLSSPTSEITMPANGSRSLRWRIFAEKQSGVWQAYRQFESLMSRHRSLASIFVGPKATPNKL
jgi:hypothetical protein